METEEQRTNRLEAERDVKAALTRLRVTLADYGAKPPFQSTLIELIRDCRNALNVVSTALPYLPYDQMEMMLIIGVPEAKKGEFHGNG
jgi:hypothetical protein